MCLSDCTPWHHLHSPRECLLTSNMPTDVRGQLASVRPHASNTCCASSLSAPVGLAPWPCAPREACSGHAYSAGPHSQPHAAVTSPGACLKELLSDLAHFILDLLRNQNACFPRHTALCWHSSLTHTPALVGAVGYSSVSSVWRSISLPSLMFLPWHLSLDSLP